MSGALLEKDQHFSNQTLSNVILNERRERRSSRLLMKSNDGFLLEKYDYLRKLNFLPAKPDPLLDTIWREILRH